MTSLRASATRGQHQPALYPQENRVWESPTWIKCRYQPDTTLTEIMKFPCPRCQRETAHEYIGWNPGNEKPFLFCEACAFDSQFNPPPANEGNPP